MGTMRLGELSSAGKIFIFLLILCLIGGGYYGYVTYRFNNYVDAGNSCLSSGDYEQAIASYSEALEIKSFGSSQAEINSLINNANTIKEAEIARLVQEVVAIIGDKYSGIEGANTIAIRKGYYKAVETDEAQKKLDRLEELKYEQAKLNQFQNTLNKQKNQIKYRKR
ncbi:hypothetical protein [Bacteroides faecalis]|uniref:Uncharacterized protein n=1 Tax=Bacteroides faecalis TaxID=2447885 RepID=A0A401LQC3_9BACE|nr:hypothetical protein [Bacteroides faecalis]GCB33679.1 hypothetical protein KGMB02408_06240 [Bacteroides faecalis]